MFKNYIHLKNDINGGETQNINKYFFKILIKTIEFRK